MVAGEGFEGAGEDEDFAAEGVICLEAGGGDLHSPFGEAVEVFLIFGGGEPIADAGNDFVAHTIEVGEVFGGGLPFLEVLDSCDAVAEEVFGEVVAALFAEVADAEGVDEAFERDLFGFFNRGEEVGGAAVFE